MTAPVRSLPPFAAVLTISAAVLLGCSSSPAASPGTATTPNTAAASTPSVDPATPDPLASEPAPSDPAPSDPAPSDPVSTGGGSSGEATGDPADGGSESGPARIVVSGAICDLLEKKIPVAEMATLTGLAVDRTVEMGEAWCVYASSGPDDIVTVQYQKEAKNSFDLLGADGTPVDTTTLGVPMYSEQDLNGVNFLDGTTQWEVRVGNAGNGAVPAQYAAAITIAQRLLG